MREIKFRGKFKKNSEWEYGGLRFGDMGQAYILPHGASHRIELVNRDTVGQFTGLKDKSGKEIYEGDVLKALIDSKMGSAYFDVGEVVFHPNAAQFVLRKGNGCTNIAFNVEVIGNIYENPELLTV